MVGGNTTLVAKEYLRLGPTVIAACQPFVEAPRRRATDEGHRPRSQRKEAFGGACGDIGSDNEVVGPEVSSSASVNGLLLQMAFTALSALPPRPNIAGLSKRGRQHQSMEPVFETSAQECMSLIKP